MQGMRSGGGIYPSGGESKRVSARNKLHQVHLRGGGGRSRLRRLHREGCQKEAQCEKKAKERFGIHGFLRFLSDGILNKKPDVKSTRLEEDLLILAPSSQHRDSSLVRVRVYYSRRKKIVARPRRNGMDKEHYIPSAEKGNPRSTDLYRMS
jgi:hypothetical protein